jgi:hypothetical protein
MKAQGIGERKNRYLLKCKICIRGKRSKSTLFGQSFFIHEDCIGKYRCVFLTYKIDNGAFEQTEVLCLWNSPSWKKKLTMKVQEL